MERASLARKAEDTNRLTFLQFFEKQVPFGFMPLLRRLQKLNWAAPRLVWFESSLREPLLHEHLRGTGLRSFLLVSSWQGTGC
jgi:hypothetical protein